MTGKNKCKILKDIRKAIAEANEIEYVTTECKFKGECKGTCPKCESEVRYLESELEKRRMCGKTIAVSGVAAAMIFSSGCVLSENHQSEEALMGDIAFSASSENTESSNEVNNIPNGQSQFVEVTEGLLEISYEPEISDEPSSGDNTSDETVEIDGDLEYFPSDEIVETDGDLEYFPSDEIYEVVGELDINPNDYSIEDSSIDDK